MAILCTIPKTPKKVKRLQKDLLIMVVDIDNLDSLSAYIYKNCAIAPIYTKTVYAQMMRLQ
ncbi:MAG: hypothetical protein EXS60_01880 [Candidatus Pacebacteria bacterium]|nr:hypothetical protein [Candidatus Paceibacterota bacterium]